MNKISRINKYCIVKNQILRKSKNQFLINKLSRKTEQHL